MHAAAPYALDTPAAVAAAASVRPDVSLIVVLWNSAAILQALLESLAAALEGVVSAEVVFVDNASDDDSAALVERWAPWARVIPAGGNLGYAGGINVALPEVRATKGVLVLNPDAVPARGCVNALLEAVSRDDRTGIAVPRILGANGCLKFSLRREPTLRRALGEALLGGHRAARYPMWGDMVRDPSKYVDGAVADWATGAAMMLRCELVREIGLWSEDFFLYSEETDYALRARDAGWSLRLVSAAAVHHPGGEMSRSPWLWSVLVRNRVSLYARRHGPVASTAYKAVVLVNEGMRALLGRPTHRAAFCALLLGRLPARS